MNISIGSDHAGYEYKAFLIAKLKEWGHTVEDEGTTGPESVDYPDYAHLVASKVDQGKVAVGVLLCGSANGVAMTANKHQNVRAGICWNNEIAKLTRQHNNSNIICIPARYVSKRMASSMLKQFLSTEFEGGRHDRRVGKISCS